MAEFEFRSNLSNVNNAMAESIDRMLTKIGLYVEGKVKLKITDLDAVDTGYLRNSVDNKVDMDNKSVSIGTNCEYAIFVHEGTRRMRSRPFLKDTGFEEINNIKRIGEEELQRGMS